MHTGTTLFPRPKVCLVVRGHGPQCHTQKQSHKILCEDKGGGASWSRAGRQPAGGRWHVLATGDRKRLGLGEQWRGTGCISRLRQGMWPGCLGLLSPVSLGQWPEGSTCGIPSGACDPEKVLGYQQRRWDPEAAGRVVAAGQCSVEFCPFPTRRVPVIPQGCGQVAAWVGASRHTSEGIGQHRKLGHSQTFTHVAVPTSPGRLRLTRATDITCCEGKHAPDLRGRVKAESVPWSPARSLMSPRQPTCSPEAPDRCLATCLGLQRAELDFNAWAKTVQIQFLDVSPGVLRTQDTFLSLPSASRSSRCPRLRVAPP